MGENYITCQAEKGSINISEEVITSVVKSAISEIEGVAGLSNTAGSELAELIGAPVLTGMSSVDLIPSEYPLYAGRTGMTGSRGGNLCMAASDVFFSIGSRQSFLQAPSTSNPVRHR